MSLGKLLDQTQYAQRSILKYEWMYGQGGLSNGGPEITAEVSKLVNFKASDKVLDVGCGIGGPAFHIAQNYGCSVHSIDFSHNMMNIAKERLKHYPQEVVDRVTLSECDFNEVQFDDNSFDVIHCRDTMVHVKEKKDWVKKFHRVLKPGGKLLITDYCRGKHENSEDYKAYITQRGYFVLTVIEYIDLIKSMGFVDVLGESRADQYGSILKKEISKLNNCKQEFLEKFSLEEFESINELWNSKLKRNVNGDHTWAIITAKKV